MCKYKIVIFTTKCDCVLAFINLPLVSAIAIFDKLFVTKLLNHASTAIFPVLLERLAGIGIII